METVHAVVTPITPLMWVAVAVFAGVFILISTEKINKTITAILGACFFIFIHAVEGNNVLKIIDWNVIFVLIGLMLIIVVTKRTGLFQFVAIKAAKFSKGEPYRILIVLNIVTALFSTILDNVTTVLILSPVAILLAIELGILPQPFIITMAIASNIGGTATLIGDPPNIMIGSAVGFTFMDFIVNTFPVIVVIMIVYCFGLYFFFRHRLPVANERRARILEIDESKVITDKKLLIKCLVVLFLVVIGLTFHGLLDIPPAIISLFGGFALLLMADRHHIEQFLAEIEWGTIFFFVGLFIMVEGLVQLGAISALASAFISATGGDIFLTAVLLLWFAGVLSAFVDNIPFVATMIPLLQNMGQTLGAAAITPLWWALSLGACLGGNGTLIGASANVVSAGICKKSGYHISFKDFAKFGIPVTLASLVICSAYISIRYFL